MLGSSPESEWSKDKGLAPGKSLQCKYGRNAKIRKETKPETHPNEHKPEVTQEVQTVQDCFVFISSCDTER